MASPMRAPTARSPRDLGATPLFIYRVCPSWGRRALGALSPGYLRDPAQPSGGAGALLVPAMRSLKFVLEENGVDAPRALATALSRCGHAGRQ
jgi:hypothetical protein